MQPIDLFHGRNWVSQRRVLIVGGGIAGLALTRALRGHEIHVEVAERRETWKEPGSGLYLPANAVRALQMLGLGEQVAHQAPVVARQHFLDARGRQLLQIDLKDLWGDVGDCRAISRQHLHDVLRHSVDPAVIRLGVTVTGVEDGLVTFQDGSTRSYDLVVGADGIGSDVRRCAFGSQASEFLGQVCWRFVVEGHPEILDWTARLGSGGRTFLTVHLGGGRVYCYAEMAGTDPVEPDADWREFFADFAGPVPELLAEAEDAYFAPLAEISGADWIRSRTVLIGDAAHACSPSMAQGGAMALEDALVLAEELQHQPIDHALTTYRDRRAGRVAWVLQQNHRRDRARSLPDALRNSLLRVAGKKIIKGNHALLHSLP